MLNKSVGEKKNDFLQQKPQRARQQTAESPHLFRAPSFNCYAKRESIIHLARGVIHRDRLTSLVNKRQKNTHTSQIKKMVNRSTRVYFRPPRADRCVRKSVPGSPLVGHVDSRVLAGRLHVERSTVLQLLLVMHRRRVVVRRHGLMLPAHLEPRNCSLCACARLARMIWLNWSAEAA